VILVASFNSAELRRDDPADRGHYEELLEISTRAGVGICWLRASVYETTRDSVSRWILQKSFSLASPTSTVTTRTRSIIVLSSTIGAVRAYACRRGRLRLRRHGGARGAAGDFLEAGGIETLIQFIEKLKTSLLRRVPSFVEGAKEVLRALRGSERGSPAAGPVAYYPARARRLRAGRGPIRANPRREAE